MANKKLTAAKLLNLISGLQTQFDKLKKKPISFSGAISPLVSRETPSAARPVQPKVVADKGIEPKIKPKKKVND